MSIETQALDAMFDDDVDAVREILDALDADSLDALAEVALALSAVAVDMARDRREPVALGARLWWHLTGVAPELLVSMVLVLAAIGLITAVTGWR